MLYNDISREVYLGLGQIFDQMNTLMNIFIALYNKKKTQKNKQTLF